MDTFSYDPAFAYFVVFVFSITVIFIVVFAQQEVALAAFQLLRDVILFRFWGDDSDDEQPPNHEDGVARDGDDNVDAA